MTPEERDKLKELILSKLRTKTDEMITEEEMMIFFNGMKSNTKIKSYLRKEFDKDIDECERRIVTMQKRKNERLLQKTQLDELFPD